MDDVALLSLRLKRAFLFVSVSVLMFVFEFVFKIEPGKEQFGIEML